MKNRGIENVNVTEVLLKMRNYRMGLIQTADQLRFCYVALLQGLKVNWDACGEVSISFHPPLPRNFVIFIGEENTFIPST